MILDRDTLSVVQSYLNIEDILTVYQDNLEVRNKLIAKYYRVLPTFPEMIKCNYFQTLKYAITERKYTIYDRDLQSAI